MFVMSLASYIFTSFRVVCGDLRGCTVIVLEKNRLSFRTAFIDTEFYYYENRNMDSRAEIVNPIFLLHIFRNLIYMDPQVKVKVK